MAHGMGLPRNSAEFDGVWSLAYASKTEGSRQPTINPFKADSLAFGICEGNIAMNRMAAGFLAICRPGFFIIKKHFFCLFFVVF
jgi:hypothetical protein